MWDGSRELAQSEGFEIRRELKGISNLLNRIVALVPSDPP